MSFIVGINCLAQACCLSTAPPILIDLILSYNEFLCLRDRGGLGHEVERKASMRRLRDTDGVD